MMCKNCDNEMHEKFARPKDLAANLIWLECDKCDVWVEDEV